MRKYKLVYITAMISFFNWRFFYDTLCSMMHLTLITSNRENKIKIKYTHFLQFVFSFLYCFLLKCK